MISSKFIIVLFLCIYFDIFTFTFKYKTQSHILFIFQISELFGGMEVCGLSVLVGKDGREHIIRASDSTFPLMGDTQEDDRRFIADLVVSRMQNVCRPPMGKTVSRSSVSSRGSPSEDMPPLSAGPRPVPTGAPPPIPERSTPGVGSIGRLGSLSSVTDLITEQQPTDKAPALANLGRRDSQGLFNTFFYQYWHF